MRDCGDKHDLRPVKLKGRMCIWCPFCGYMPPHTREVYLDQRTPRQRRKDEAVEYKAFKVKAREWRVADRERRKKRHARQVAAFGALVKRLYSGN